MKKVLSVLMVVSSLASIGSAFAATAHDACQKAALSASLEELRKEFPDQFGHTTIDSIDEKQNQVTVEIDNESISDLSIDVTVRIKRNGSECEVIGTPDVVMPDPS